MISGNVIQSWFLLLALAGVCLGGVAFFSVILAMPLYFDLIARLRREHRDIYDGMRGKLPGLVQKVSDPHNVDTNAFLAFLYDDREVLTPRTQLAKQKYRRAAERNKKLLRYWIVYCLTGAGSIVVAFFLIIVFNVVKE